MCELDIVAHDFNPSQCLEGRGRQILMSSRPACLCSKFLDSQRYTKLSWVSENICELLFALELSQSVGIGMWGLGCCCTVLGELFKLPMPDTQGPVQWLLSLLAHPSAVLRHLCRLLFWYNPLSVYKSWSTVVPGSFYFFPSKYLLIWNKTFKKGPKESISVHMETVFLGKMFWFGLVILTPRYQELVSVGFK